ncbi:hypothetical protein QQ045_010108 [Rhodiola kirilowii]
MSDDDKLPLWQFIEKIEKTGGGGNWIWKCKICGEERQGTYTRVKVHLLRIKNKGIAGCLDATSQQIREMTKLEEDYEAKLVSMTSKSVPLPFGPSPSSRTSQTNSFDVGALKKRKSDSPLVKAFDNQKRNELDCMIARMFYTGGLPFTLARNPYYQSTYNFAANNNLGGYVPLGYNRLRTTLLDQEKKHVELSLAPIKNTWGAKRVTIVTDGWSDPQRRPIINFMACCESGPMFIKAVNCAGEVKGKEFIANLLREVIDEVGHQNVVQVITDNASNCKGAGEIIERIYPHIYWTPCVVHTLNLALKNICAARNVNNEETYAECHWITEVHGDVVHIKNFIVNHGKRLSIYSQFTPLKLLSVGETRFASIVIMLKRFKLVKRALEGMVMCDQWTSYRDDDQGKARFVREKIVDGYWWDKVDYILSFTSPINDMIRVCDTDKPCLHLVYEMWDVMIEMVKRVIYEHEHIDESETSTLYDVVHNILVARWAKNNTPLHCLAHSLNPRYYSHEWLTEDVTREPPHTDTEVSMERRKCFKRLFPNQDDYIKVTNEYASFSLERGDFGDSDAIQMKYTMDPRRWWASFGAATLFPQKLAIRLLGQPTSSSCCERNWSTYAFIHSLKRNKLNLKRAEDLVFIHNNLRLLSRKNPEYLDEKTKMWDVGGSADVFGSLEETNIHQFVDLSLDEPEMESVFFEDNQ